MQGSYTRASLEVVDLVHAFLELRERTPDLGEWSEERLAANPPRLYRLLQLKALFRAFGIEWDPESFAQGGFIRPDGSRYSALVAKIDLALPEGARRDVGAIEGGLKGCFALLLRFREDVQRVVSFSGGFLEASGAYLYALQVAAEIGRDLQTKARGLDEVLGSLISPESRSFSVEELVRDHGYPDVDLYEIDEAWL